MFSVHPMALEGYAAQAGRASDDATDIMGYLLGYQVDGGWDGTLIELVGNSHVKAMNLARDLSGRAATVLHDSQNGLAASAGYYRATDAQAAAAFDATMPGRCASVPSVLELRWDSNVCGPGSPIHASRLGGSNRSTTSSTHTHPLAALDNIGISNWH